VTPQVRQSIAQRLQVQPAAVPSGVLVRDVQALSAAADAGLRDGYIITQIGDRPVRNLAEYREAVEDLDEGEVTFVRAYNPVNNSQGFFAIRVPR
jgi:S1-C subfamily serine protease